MIKLKQAYKILYPKDLFTKDQYKNGFAFGNLHSYAVNSFSVCKP